MPMLGPTSNCEAVRSHYDRACTEHTHVAKVHVTSILQMKKLGLRALSDLVSGKEPWTRGLGELGSHPGVSVSLREPQPVSGFCTPSGVEGLSRRLIFLLALRSVAPHEPQALGERPVLAAGFPGSSSSALAFSCPPSPLLGAKYPIC